MSKIIEDLRTKLASIGGMLDEGDYDLNLDAPPAHPNPASASGRMTSIPMSPVMSSSVGVPLVALSTS
jgi:hypothetical protein